MKHFRPLALTLVVALIAGSCRVLPEQHGVNVQVIQDGGQLAELNPTDIVVAPVVHIVEGQRCPDLMLRESFQRGLVRRRYSPLALEFIDTRVVDASYPLGALHEDAVFEIVIHSWDDKYWPTRKAMVVDLEARMWDPDDPGAPPLWAGRLPMMRYDLGDEKNRANSERDLLRRLCDRIVVDLMAAMPAHETGPSQP